MNVDSRRSDIIRPLRGDRFATGDISAQRRNANAAKLEQALLRLDLTSVLGCVETRTLVVHGAEDALTSAGARVLRAHLPHATVIAFRRVGHHPERESPDRFQREVRTFLG